MDQINVPMNHATNESITKLKSEKVIQISPHNGEGKCDTEEKSRQIESKVKQLIEQNSLLNSFLSAMKEKMSDIVFINFDDYEEESEIGEGATSSVKIVVKKELKGFDIETFQRFLLEAEILLKLRHPCIIRICGVNYGDKGHCPSILLSLEPISLEKAINESQSKLSLACATSTAATSCTAI